MSKDRVVSKDNHLILVVEDDNEIRETLVEILEDRGYRAMGAADGKEALEKLGAERARPPCVILLDLMMPVMDGRSFRQAQLRDALLAHIPVVVISAFPDMSQFADLAAAAYLRKPVDVPSVMSVVTQFCPN